MFEVRESTKELLFGITAEDRVWLLDEARSDFWKLVDEGKIIRNNEDAYNTLILEKVKKYKKDIR